MNRTILERKILRKFWWLYVYLRFQLLDKRRLGRPVLEEIGGRPFLVLPDVFNPNLFYTGAFMSRHLNSERIPEGSTVLDLGTGSGVGAIAAARWANRVVAVDVDSSAVRCARINTLLNEVEDRVQVLQGDLFSPLSGQRFDVVLFNPPYFRGQPKTPFERAFRSEDIAERFASSLASHLTPSGYALLTLSSLAEEKRFLQALRARGLNVELSAEEDIRSEVLRLYRVGSSG